MRKENKEDDNENYDEIFYNGFYCMKVNRIIASLDYLKKFAAETLRRKELKN